MGCSVLAPGRCERFGEAAVGNRRPSARTSAARVAQGQKAKVCPSTGEGREQAEAEAAAGIGLRASYERARDAPTAAADVAATHKPLIGLRPSHRIAREASTPG